METYESFPTAWFVMLSGTSWTLGQERVCVSVCVCVHVCVGCVGITLVWFPNVKAMSSPHEAERRSDF